MPKKKIADSEVIMSVEGGAAVKPAKTPGKKTQAPGASANAVTHKHKKSNIATVVELANFEALAPVQAAPTQEEIARLAYSYWEMRGYWGGSQQEDWLRAEAELRNRG